MLVGFTDLIILHKECILSWTVQDAEHLHASWSFYFDFLIVDAEVWCVARLVEFLFSVYKALTVIPALHKTFMLAYTVISAHGRQRQEDPGVRGHSQLQSKFKANLSYVRLI